MSESKVVSRKTAVWLGVICILLAVGLVADRLNYISIINNKDAEFQNYVSTHKHSNAEYDALQSAYENYVANQNHTEAQYDALQSQYDELKEPKLIATLKTEDVRLNPQSPRLHIYGNVVNVGKDDTYTSTLYVEAFQGTTLAINKSIELGYIFGRSFAYYVDQEVFYNGSSLTAGHIWSQPDGINWTWSK